MKEKFITTISLIPRKAKMVGIATSVATANFIASVPVFAAEDAGGLDPAVQASISNGFTSAGKAIAVIVGLGVTATIGVIACSGGAKAGLKWVKGIFAKAS